jgi:DNA-binding response OmpR family regulator
MPTRILIAVPDESLANSYEDFLCRDGFDVATVTNGLDCLAKLRTWTPDVLVLEFDMPCGGGFGVLAMMHDGLEIPRVPVMVLTARRDFQDLGGLRLFEMMSDLHVKPVPPEQLARIIRRRLRATGAEWSDAVTWVRTRFGNWLLLRYGQ